MRVYALTDIGSVRAVNEDSYFVPASGEQYCCVADGMGGAQAGEVASGMAVDIFTEYMKDILPPPHERLRRAVAASSNGGPRFQRRLHQGRSTRCQRAPRSGS